MRDSAWMVMIHRWSSYVEVYGTTVEGELRIEWAMMSFYIEIPSARG